LDTALVDEIDAIAGIAFLEHEFSGGKALFLSYLRQFNQIGFGDLTKETTGFDRYGVHDGGLSAWSGRANRLPLDGSASDYYGP
jgi:hypothetical protein